MLIVLLILYLCGVRIAHSVCRYVFANPTPRHGVHIGCPTLVARLTTPRNSTIGAIVGLALNAWSAEYLNSLQWSPDLRTAKSSDNESFRYGALELIYLPLNAVNTQVR